MRSGLGVGSGVAALLLATLHALACGNVDDLSLAAPPLTHVRGHVDLAAIGPAAGGKALRAALVWGAVPRYNLACVKYPANAELQAACRDPFLFVPGQIHATVPVAADGDGTFGIALDQLPSANVSVGTDAARIAWGSLVVVADTDDSGTFNLFSAEDDRGRNAIPADVPLAASFWSLHAPQQRIAFREGGWDAASFFYPSPGCEPPPAGFSVLSTPGMVGLEAAPGECALRRFDAPVELQALAAEQSRALACATQNSASVRQPGEKPPGKDRDGHGPGMGGGRGDGGRPDEGTTTTGKLVCLDADTLAYIVDGACPDITVYPLAGCRDNLLCSETDWDLRQQPPSWWTCRP